jgi:hypothetical protein
MVCCAPRIHYPAPKSGLAFRRRNRAQKGRNGRQKNTSLLLDTGQLTETGLRRTADGGLTASWALSWPEQQTAGVEPIMLQAYFGGSFHHPHLRGTTVHDWPLNVFTDEDAAAQLSILRAIASSDLHNLVYRTDYRIVPAVNHTTSS